MAINLKRLLEISRGETGGVTGVTGVTALHAGCNPPVTCGVTPFVTQQAIDKIECNAVTPQLRDKVAKKDFVPSRGVTTGVTKLLDPAKAGRPVVPRCSCGAVGTRSDNWFLWEQERAEWFCITCYHKPRRDNPT